MAVEGGLMFKHAEDGVEEFAHDGNQSGHLGFAANSQMLIEGAGVALTATGTHKRNLLVGLSAC